MSDAKSKSNTPHDAPLGVTFGEIRSDEPHQPVTTKKLEMYEPLIKDTQAHTTHFGEKTSEKQSFDVERAFHGDVHESGTVISDKRRASPTIGNSLKGVFHEWFGSKSETDTTREQSPVIASEPIRLPSLRRDQPSNEAVKKIPQTPTKAVPQPKVPSDHPTVRIENIRTLRSDTERITNARNMSSPEMVMKQPEQLKVPQSKHSPEEIPQSTRDVPSALLIPEVPTDTEDTQLKPSEMKSAIEVELKEMHTHTKKESQGDARWASEVEPKKEKAEPMPQSTERITTPNIAPVVPVTNEVKVDVPKSATRGEVAPHKFEPKQSPVIIAPVVPEEKRHVPTPPPPPVSRTESPIIPVPRPREIVHEDIIVPQLETKLEKTSVAPPSYTEMKPEQKNERPPKPAIHEELIAPRIPIEEVTPSEIISPQKQSVDTALDTRIQELQLAQSDVKARATTHGWVRPVLIGILGIVVLSGIGYALYRFVMPSMTQEGEPSGFETTSMLFPQAFFQITQVPHITTSVQTVLEAVRTLGTENSESLLQVVPMYTADTVTIPYTTNEFLTGINAQLSSDVLPTLDDRFMLGYHTETQSPFLIFAVYNFDTLFVEMRTWEKSILKDLYPLFGDVTQLTGHDAVVHNKPARILKDAEGKTALIYVFLSNTTLVIAKDESVISLLGEKLLAE